MTREEDLCRLVKSWEECSTIRKICLFKYTTLVIYLLQNLTEHAKDKEMLIMKFSHKCQNNGKCSDVVFTQWCLKYWITAKRPAMSVLVSTVPLSVVFNVTI